MLAQQRAEQSRLSADQNRESNDAPLDPASFIQSLPASLRQQVLADMDDSMVAVLPSDLAAEANVLRREVEERHRRLVQERLFAQGAGLLSGILRHSGSCTLNATVQRLAATAFALFALHQITVSKEVAKLKNIGCYFRESTYRIDFI